MARSTYFDLGRSADACPGSESGYAQRFQCGNIVKRRIWTRMYKSACRDLPQQVLARGYLEFELNVTRQHRGLRISKKRRCVSPLCPRGRTSLSIGPLICWRPRRDLKPRHRRERAQTNWITL